WIPLLQGNPLVDRLVLLRRGSLGGLRESWRDLRAESYDLAIDFQGLLKSALAACVARPQRLFGFDNTRERAAALFYTDRAHASSTHVVDRNLDLAATAGATRTPPAFPLPPGHPEGDLPSGDFVLASPLAGWPGKQWPSEHYSELAARLDMPLVVNVPAAG